MNHAYANRLALTSAARQPTLRPGMRSSRRQPPRNLRVDLAPRGGANLPRRRATRVLWGHY
jgi:hypothetical protein